MEKRKTPVCLSVVLKSASTDHKPASGGGELRGIDEAKGQNIRVNHFGQLNEDDLIDCQYAVARMNTVYCFALAARNKPESPCPYVHKGSKARCPFRGPMPWEVQG